MSKKDMRPVSNLHIKYQKVSQEFEDLFDKVSSYSSYTVGIAGNILVLLE